jgi:tRNA threonylcarbamoyladenosine biosynthesis protein TsaE
MNSNMAYVITTHSSAQTQDVARKLSTLLQGGDVIELVSDLGGGKTTFVQGLAAGLGYDASVTSPTFTLSNIYQLPGKMQLHHYDLYRLGVGGVVADALAEDINDLDNIIVIEWAGVAHNRLPKDRLTVTFEVTGVDSRRLIFSADGAKSSAIIEGIKS